MELRIVRYALRNPEAVYGRLVLLCRGRCGRGRFRRNRRRRRGRNGSCTVKLSRKHGSGDIDVRAEGEPQTRRNKGFTHIPASERSVGGGHGGYPVFPIVVAHIYTLPVHAHIAVAFGKEGYVKGEPRYNALPFERHQFRIITAKLVYVRVL